MNKTTASTSSSLVRGISRWDFVALIINITIGAGILGLPSKVYSLLGSYSIWAFAGCALLIMALILCFAEVGSRFKGTGGPYLYTLTTLGPLAGFIAGWVLWLSRLFSFASVCNLFVDYVAFLWPTASQGNIRISLIVAVILLLTVINFRGIRTATIINNVITVSKLLVLLIFVGVGLFYVQPQAHVLAKPLSISSFASSVLLLIFAFSGFDVAAVPAGEVKDPQKTVPYGLFIALAVVTLLYIGIQYVCMETLPGLAQSTKPIAEAATRFMGTGGSYLITIGALITMLGTLNVLLLTSSRLLFAMAEQGQLFKQLGYVHQKFHTPWVALWLSALVLVVLTASGSFIHALTISAIIRLFTFITTCLALPLLRKKENTPAPFTVKFGVAIAIFSILICLLLLVNITRQEAVDSLIAVLIGVAIYFSYRYVFAVKSLFD